MSNEETAAEQRPVDGTVVRAKQFESGWSILTVDRAGMPETWVGIMPELKEGMPVRATGEWQKDAKWGRQFKVTSILVRMPDAADPDALATFLSKLVPGIGIRTTTKIVDTLGAETIPALENDRAKVAAVKGMSDEKAAKLCEEWQKHSVEGQLIVQLGRFGIKGAVAKRVVKRYGSRAAEMVEKHPYVLAMEVDGIGFKTADLIAEAVGIPKDSVERMEAGLIYAFDEKFSSRGHCYAKQGPLFDAAADLLGVGDGPLSDGLRSAQQSGRFVIEEAEGDDPRIFPSGLYVAERRVASRLARLLAAPPLLRKQDEGLPDGDGDSIDMGDDVEFYPGRREVQPEVDCPPREEMVAHGEKAIVEYEKQTGMTLAPAQKEAVRAVMREKVFILTGGPGVGKCLKVGTKVLMFDGSLRNVEAVRDGELVMGPDSKPRRVSGCIRETGPLYEIRPVKGDPWTCNDVHILTLVRSGTNLSGKVIDIPLNEWLALPSGSKWRRKGKLFRVGVEFPEKPTVLDPYVMGLWLGDGDRGGTGVSKPDPEVSEAVLKEAERLGLRGVRRFDKRTGCWETRAASVEWHKNAFLDEVRTALDENHGKRIPDAYKLNSRAMRERLLAGLVDTDGHISNGCCEIISVFPKLAEDIAFLARSLGLAAYISDKEVQLAGWDAPRGYKRVIISGDLSGLPCRIARKQAAPRKQIKDVLRTGFDAVPVGVGEYAGFQVDGDGRFLLGDFTVTHNTQTTKAIIYALDTMGFDIACCAPTGRAAKRVKEATGRQASTVHRLLEYHPEKGFQRNAGRRLQQTVIIGDEFSMTDITLMAHLTDAIDDGARFIIIGDVDQLPSVGPGAVLRDLIDSGTIPVVRLTEVFRQAAGSRIITNAHRVNRGHTPEKPQGESDFYWVERQDAERAAATAIQIVTEKLSKRGISTRDCMVISPQKNGEAGVHAMNARLQEIINPAAPCLTLGKAPKQRVFRVGDPVMQLKNDYERAVWNGDIGSIISVDTERTSMVVSIDGVEVLYEKKHFDNVTLAYACSGHKMQGGQAKAIVVLLLKQHFMLLSRPWLYTALTRAEKLCVLVADSAAVEIALSETKRENRNTGLRGRMQLAVKGEV